MAKPIYEVAQELISLLENRNISLNSQNKKILGETGFINLNGFECAIPNVQGYNRFGVNVNKQWFQNPEDKSKPNIRRKTIQKKYEIDFYLFPIGNNLFALHFLELRKFTLELEKERDKWINKIRWGMIIHEKNSAFSWVDNTKTFPLCRINSIEDFSFQIKSKEPIACDISEPPETIRSLCKTYRILRDTQLTREIKELYGFLCQICGKAVQFDNGERYAEAHHIKPLGKDHRGPDEIENILCVCPNHHALLDFGGIKLEHSTIEKKHNLSKEYINYHNQKVYKGV